MSAILDLQGMGIPCVNFFCDNVREFRRVPPQFIPFDLHWVPEFEALPMYRRAGLPHLHAPMPCWVRPALRFAASAETDPPTFIGSADRLRRDLLARAQQAGAEIVARGTGWASPDGAQVRSDSATGLWRTIRNQVSLVRGQGLLALLRKVRGSLWPVEMLEFPLNRVAPPVSQEEYFRITRDAVITIGINRVPSPHASQRKPLVYSRLRDIEAPMLGACYLTEWTEGLEQLYETGVEIETYRTPEEMSAKIEALTSSPFLRRRMRERAQARALADHSVSRSLRRICSALGLTKPQ